MLHAYDPRDEATLTDATGNPFLPGVTALRSVRPGALHLRGHRPDPAQHHRRAGAGTPQGARQRQGHALLAAPEERVGHPVTRRGRPHPVAPRRPPPAWRRPGPPSRRRPVRHSRCRRTSGPDRPPHPVGGGTGRFDGHRRRPGRRRRRRSGHRPPSASGLGLPPPGSALEPRSRQRSAAEVHGRLRRVPSGPAHRPSAPACRRPGRRRTPAPPPRRSLWRANHHTAAATPRKARFSQVVHAPRDPGRQPAHRVVARARQPKARKIPSVASPATTITA